MTVKEIIKLAGAIPTCFTLDNGDSYQVEVCQNEIEKDYSAFIWQVVDGKREHIITFALGATPDAARENLVKKLTYT